MNAAPRSLLNIAAAALAMSAVQTGGAEVVIRPEPRLNIFGRRRQEHPEPKKYNVPHSKPFVHIRLAGGVHRDYPDGTFDDVVADYAGVMHTVVEQINGFGQVTKRIKVGRQARL